MGSDGYVLGVDFGTSNTVAVARLPDGRRTVLLVDGSPQFPSAVYADPAGPLRVGRDAVLSARLEPARFEPNPKARIDDGTVLLGDRGFAVTELVSAVLRRAAEPFPGPVRPRLVLTHPVAWGSARRETLAAAARAAGFDRVRLVPEPVAAAAYFTDVLGHRLPLGSILIVHDLGAGTFDVSAVRRTAVGFDVVAVDGRDGLGGLELDAALVDHLGAVHREGNPEAWQRLERPATAEDRRARHLFWDDVRAAKERLSRSATAEVLVPHAGTALHVTREELESLAGPVLSRSVAITAALVEGLGVPRGAIAGVFLVGGSSRVPLLSSLLFHALGYAPTAVEQPELVVAEGSVLGEPEPPAEVAQPPAEVAAPPAHPRRSVLRRVARAAVVPLAALTALTVAGVATGLAFVALVAYSVLTGQGWLPNWGPLPG